MEQYQQAGAVKVQDGSGKTLDSTTLWKWTGIVDALQESLTRGASEVLPAPAVEAPKNEQDHKKVDRRSRRRKSGKK